MLRVVRTVFLGRGPQPPPHPACREAGAEESELERGRAPWATIATGTTLLVLGLAWGLVPGLIDAATHAAARFADHAGYAASVLQGPAANAPAPEGEAPTAAAWLYGLASGVLAIGFALLRTMPEGPLRGAALRAHRRLRGVDRGRRRRDRLGLRADPSLNVESVTSGPRRHGAAGA